jgi:hypothetical protein
MVLNGGGIFYKRRDFILYYLNPLQITSQLLWTEVVNFDETNGELKMKLHKVIY